MTRNLLAFWIAAVLVLVAAPVAVNAARPSTYEAGIEIFAIDESVLPDAQSTAAFVSRLLADPLTAQEAARTSALGIDAARLRDDIRIEPTRRSVLITARADSPTHATALATSVGFAVANAAARDRIARARTELIAVRADLAASPTPDEREQLSQRAAALERELETPPAEIVLGAAPAPPPPSGYVDETLDRLPGALPPRPDLAWTAVAGLLLAVLVCGAAYVYSTAPGRGRPR